jgi:hypothetical protein
MNFVKEIIINIQLVVFDNCVNDCLINIRDKLVKNGK